MLIDVCFVNKIMLNLIDFFFCEVQLCVRIKIMIILG